MEQVCLDDHRGGWWGMKVVMLFIIVMWDGIAVQYYRCQEADLVRPERFIYSGSPGYDFGSLEQLEDVAGEKVAWDTL